METLNIRNLTHLGINYFVYLETRLIVSQEAIPQVSFQMDIEFPS